MIDWRIGVLESPIERVFAAALLREMIWHHAVGSDDVMLVCEAQAMLGVYRADVVLALCATMMGPNGIEQHKTWLVVELDGAAFHDADRDRVRDADLAREGLAVLRFTGAEVTRSPQRCAIRALWNLDELAQGRPMSPTPNPVIADDVARILDLRGQGRHAEADLLTRERDARLRAKAGVR